MANPGYSLRAVIRIAAVAMLSIGALFAAVLPSAATPLFEHVVFDMEPSLGLDLMGHDAMLNAAPPNQASATAFTVGAVQHDLYIGGGFTYGGLMLPI